ncbi:hypothetical protein DN730_05155 [Marinomonas piezotolerans]|uniref:Uncharacterized protein n=1 Tax=Marinomonas piezotolerans TaxID=2213058 RepID=A0A370UB26_9GAMM|nr:hypothetical protein [Marinomonas piezotolerans]RDL45006.1 hypothetical protein DN730_05155 [Marinomonas piezotolerans]
MSSIKAKQSVERSIKKHFGLALLVTLTPIVFIKAISYFAQSASLDALLIVVAPLSVLSGCAVLLKRVLEDLYDSDEARPPR